jgi:predicted acylesterase/phospholipase RssA
MGDEAPRLRAGWPYRRIALVLSGGGALGAYEAGVLRVLERAGIRPAVISGVSVGAINAMLWVAHDFDAEPIVRTWTDLRATSVGLRWTTLALRALGMLLVTIASIEVILSLIGSPELGVWHFLRGTSGRDSPSEVVSVVLDVMAWGIVAVLGATMAMISRRVEGWLAALPERRPTGAWHRWFGRALLAAGLLHGVVWAFGWPWPHRFSASVLLLGVLIWLLERAGGAENGLRMLLIRMLPETGGRGVWGSAARERLIERVLAQGHPRHVVNGPTRLMISACALDTGTMSYFVNWREPSPAFCDRVRRALGEVKVMRRPRDVVRAAVASSALPLVYEPVVIDGREFVDGAVFANQPLQVLLPDEADAVVVVLLSPGTPPAGARRTAHMVELGARLLEMANWRDLQAELRALPPGWRRDPDGAQPARVCVVEPPEPLSGGVMGFDPTTAVELIGFGERDALVALRRAGWLEPPHADVPA